MQDQRHTLFSGRAGRIAAGLGVLAALMLLALVLYLVMPGKWSLGWRLAAGLSVLGGCLLMIMGLSLAAIALRLSGHKRPGDLLADAAERRMLARGPRIVVIGGGTGLSVMLRGLKKRTSHLTAVVAVTDDGGSSGRLRDEFGILPPGDIRNCLTALADREPLMEQLFQYRFGRGSGLTGHNFGNLFITAMTDITGDFEEAIRQSSRVLAIRGQVLPSTLDRVVLAAQLEDGSILSGETLIGRTRRGIERVFLVPASPSAPKEVVEAIMSADAVVLGPGSLYTSVVPNLLVPDVLRAVRSTSALRIQVVNIMTQMGETAGYTASQHVAALHRHCGPGLVDWAVVNVEPVPADLRARYLSEEAAPVTVDIDGLRREGVRVKGARLLERSNVARHDPDALAGIICSLIDERSRNAKTSWWQYPAAALGLGGLFSKADAHEKEEGVLRGKGE